MTKRILLPAAVLFVAVFAAQKLFSAPPINWEWRKENPNIKNTERTMTVEQLKSLQKIGSVRAPGMLGVIPVTTKKIIVVRVQFSDYPFDAATTKAGAEAFFAKMRNYYSENSYGLFTASATVSNSTYTLKAISNYNNESSAAIQLLLTDTLNASNADIDYSQFDHVMIFHAGPGEETTGASIDIWSLFYPGTYTVDSKTFNGFTIVPEKEQTVAQSPLGVICHEYGHQLGLPDLYDTSVSGGRSTCGAWSLMDYPYGIDNLGVNPPHLDPWCKNMLGYIDLGTREQTSANNNMTWNSIETSQNSGFYKIPISVAANTEYFITELRNTADAGAIYDKKIPGTGLVIWHIDDAIASDATRLADNNINTGNPHLGIDLVEANGSFTTPGEASNAFVAGDTFATPMSDSFDGTESGIALSGISITGGTAGASLAMISAKSNFSFLKLINYPNPAGKGYMHPRASAGIITTIVFKSSRPPKELEMIIYNIAGEKIKILEKGEIGLKVNKSTDYNWFYEYDWDGKNDKGDNVAPGIYFYRIKADDELSVGKLAIVR